MEIRSYSVRDRQACLDILRGNTPEYFVPQDHDEFCGFLDNLPGPYFVVQQQKELVACGGWAMNSASVAALTWGMVRRNYQRRGIGRDLLRYRLEAIRNSSRARVVRILTVQLVQEFFAQAGFAVVEVEPNGYGVGLDRVTMDLQLHDVG